MNEVRMFLSGWVQRGPPKVMSMIDEPGHPTGVPAIPKEDMTMIKTISAALLAVSVLAAPALAATANTVTQTPPAKTAVTPAAKTAVTPANKTAQAVAPIKQAPVIKAVKIKKSVLNANARMGRHHHRHFRHHHHRFHR